MLKLALELAMQVITQANGGYDKTNYKTLQEDGSSAILQEDGSSTILQDPGEHG